MSDTVSGHVAAMLSIPVDSCVRLHRGRNSRVFKVYMQDGQCYLVKEYFQSQYDQRDRLRTEWQALNFLRSHGLVCVPLPVACDKKARLAVYSYIEGHPLLLTPDSEDTLAAFGDFWEALYALREEGTALGLPAASDACFCLDDLEQHLHNRNAKLLYALADSAVHKDMRAFVSKTLLPLQGVYLEKARRLLQKTHSGVARPLPEHLRMPSPSDFGAHNALQAANGRVFFVDFEYFGMDDPVKLLADTCLHPGMALTNVQKHSLVKRMSTIVASGGDTAFAARFTALAPLWRCVWCYIVLNVFVPRDDARRAFAQDAEADETLLRQQLDKAKVLVKEEYHEHESACYFSA